MEAIGLLDLIGDLDGSVIEEAKKRKRSVMPGWTKWAAAVACLCLVAGGFFAIARARKTPPVVSGDLPKIAIPEYRPDGMGFEGLCCYRAEELKKNGNPWREDAVLETLPVFRNGSYDPFGVGLPFGLTEAEMTARLESAAKKLDMEILNTKVETNAAKSTVYSVRATSKIGNLTAYADGSLVYKPPVGNKLPEEYHFSGWDTTDAEAQEVMTYLTETYASFLNFERPELAPQGGYDFKGNYNVRWFYVYDAGADLTESILNYCFRAAQFVPEYNGGIMRIKLNDGLCAAQKIGDYPLLSVAEAKEKLQNGQYQSSAPFAVTGESDIAMVELIYRSGPREETLLPYYHFYVEIPDSGARLADGLKHYAGYYVPAIRDEYISNLPTYDGHFN